MKFVDANEPKSLPRMPPVISMIFPICIQFWMIFSLHNFLGTSTWGKSKNAKPHANPSPPLHLNSLGPDRTRHCCRCSTFWKFLAIKSIKCNLNHETL